MLECIHFQQGLSNQNLLKIKIAYLLIHKSIIYETISVSVKKKEAHINISIKTTAGAYYDIREKEVN
jgi:hypothetical protein